MNFNELLLNEVSDVLVKYKEQNPNRSYSLGARYDLSKYQLSRIANKETIALDENKAFKVLQFCNPDKLSLEDLQDVYKENEVISSMLEKLAKTTLKHSKASTYVSEKVNSHFEDALNYKIMIDANLRGIVRSEILQAFGQVGVRVFEQMKSEGIIRPILKDGKERYWASNPEVEVTTYQKTVQALAANLITHSYDAENYDKGSRYLSVQFYSIDTEKAQPEIAEENDRHRERKAEIFKKYPGDDSVYSVSSYDQVDQTLNQVYKENKNKKLQ